MDILETPGTRLTSVARLRAMRSQIRCVVTYVSTNTGSWRSRDYSPIYISRNQIFWRMGRAKRSGKVGTGKKGRRFRVARRERERERGLASATIRLCFPNGATVEMNFCVVVVVARLSSTTWVDIESATPTTSPRC